MSQPSAGQHQGLAYDLHSSTPPPPPPKPHGSGSQTPVRGPPLPPPPSQHQQSGHPDSTTSQHSYVHQQNVVIRPPDSGWLPPLSNDKSYGQSTFRELVPSLSTCSTQDLQALLQSPELQAALLNNPETSHPSKGQAQDPLKQLLQSNIALSESLLQLESQLLAMRSSTQSRLLGLRALEQQHRTKITETEKELGDFSPMALYQRLNASAQEQDSLVKGIEESFLDEPGFASDREVQDFVRRLREAKRVAFLRNERKLRWDEGRVGGWR